MQKQKRMRSTLQIPKRPRNISTTCGRSLTRSLKQVKKEDCFLQCAEIDLRPKCKDAGRAVVDAEIRTKAAMRRNNRCFARLQDAGGAALGTENKKMRQCARDATILRPNASMLVEVLSSALAISIPTRRRSRVLLLCFSPSSTAHSYAAPCSLAEHDEQSCSPWSCGSLSG